MHLLLFFSQMKPDTHLMDLLPSSTITKLICTGVWPLLSALILTVIVVPLALGAGLDTQQAADGVGGAQRVRLWRLRRSDC